MNPEHHGRNNWIWILIIAAVFLICFFNFDN